MERQREGERWRDGKGGRASEREGGREGQRERETRERPAKWVLAGVALLLSV